MENRKKKATTAGTVAAWEQGESEFSHKIFYHRTGGNAMRNWSADNPEGDWEIYNERTEHRPVDEYEIEEEEP